MSELVLDEGTGQYIDDAPYLPVRAKAYPQLTIRPLAERENKQ